MTWSTTTRAAWMGLVWLALWPAASLAQGPPPAARPRPFGRISFFVSTAAFTPNGQPTELTSEFVTSFTFQTPEQLGAGVDYAFDGRQSKDSRPGREGRVSIYNAYAGARVAGGLVKLRAGQMWLSELGGLGYVAGGLVEFSQQSASTAGRLRAGVFMGAEPQAQKFGLVAGIRKMGGYAVLQGGRGRRHVAGFIRATHGRLVERQVVSFSNFIPAGRRLFVYQVGEYDLRGPAGHGEGGLSYFLVNGRVAATDRLDLHGSYHRGRSIDARTITDDILNGRAVTATAAEGYFYQSVGGRVTMLVAPQWRVYAGYTRDRNNRDSEPTGRKILGVSTTDLAGTGVDLTVSDSRIERASGVFHALYVTAGRQLGRSVYVSADYSTSLSIIRFTRFDGVTVESRPATKRVGTSAVLTLGRHMSALVTAEQTRDGQSRDTRATAGITYRFR